MGMQRCGTHFGRCQVALFRVLIRGYFPWPQKGPAEVIEVQTPHHSTSILILLQPIDLLEGVMEKKIITDPTLFSPKSLTANYTKWMASWQWCDCDSLKHLPQPHKHMKYHEITQAIKYHQEFPHSNMTGLKIDSINWTKTGCQPAADGSPLSQVSSCYRPGSFSLPLLP